ncbi:MAG: hypothetical protein N3D16_08340, partial [Anaerolineales bacterium]|nr:hypothetical protein [Anaerolineales bacterium]
MNPTHAWLLTFVAIVLAIGIDFYLMKVLHARIQKRLRDNQNPEGAVYVLGAYSPILTWLKSFWKPSAQAEIASSPQEEFEKQPSTGEFPSITEKHALSSNPLSWLERRGERVQVFLLLLGVLLYCRGILSLRTDLQLPGNESEYFQYIVQFFIQSLFQDRHFPTWNPYLHTGLPYLADPFLHIYNPFITMPCLLFGVRVGYRIALVLSYFLAAVGMMKLGRAFGFGKVVSLWLGLMYAFAGQPTAHFFQGQYVFVFSFAWIPWVFYFLVQYFQIRDIKKLIYFTIALALLYFSGAIYYTFLIVWLILIFAVVFSISVSIRPLRLQIDPRITIPVLAALLLWIGMVALHLLPMAQFRPFMSKGLDVLGSHTPFQIWLDYVSKDTFRQDAYSLLPAREEFYAYIGYMPFIAMILLPFGWRREKRRWIVAWLLVVAFVVVWINVDRMPWRDYFYRTEFFSQFRYVLRPLIFGSLAIFLLAAFGIDAAWKRLTEKLEANRGENRYRFIRVFGNFGVGVLGLLMAWGVFDNFWTNSQHLFLQDDDLTTYQIVAWLREFDSSEYYVRRNPVSGWHLAMLSSRMKFIDAWYHWLDIRRIDSPNRLNQRLVQAKPHYLIQSVEEPPPEENWRLIQQFDGTVIYQILDSLPIAFRTHEQTLSANSNEELKREEVEPLTPLFLKTNAIEVIAQGNEKDVLVVLVTHYPGWRVMVDDQRVKLENVGGYLAVKMQEGIHKYRFEFRPIVFYWGLMISLISFGIGLYIIRSDIIAWVSKMKILLSKFREFWIKSKIRVIDWEKTAPILNPAVFHQGVFVLEKGTALEEGRKVDLVVLPKEKNKIQIPVLWTVWKQVTWLLVRCFLGELSLSSILFSFALLIYFGTRMAYLSDFPIYFFTDEAIQTASAAELVRDGFYGPGKVFLPTYFPNGSYWNLSVSVYVQVIPYLLFGKSVFVTRFTSLLLSGLMVVVLVNALRRTVCPRAWWSSLLFLAVMPTWFLHSRTAFETVLF